MIQAILYDKDGTLIDLNGAWITSILSLIDRYCVGNQHLTLQIAETIGIDPIKRNVIPFSPVAQGPFHEVAEIIRQKIKHKNLDKETILQELIEVTNASETLPTSLNGTFETLKYCHGLGIIQGIISNDSAKRIAKIAQEIHIAPYITFIRGSDSGCGPKPAPEMIHQFSDEFSIDPKQVLIVGDSPADMETALGAGCIHMVGIHSDNCDPVLTKYTPHIIPDLTHLPKILEQF